MEVKELLKKRFKVIADYPHSKFDINEIIIQYFFETSTDGMYCYTTRPESPLQGSSINREFAEKMPHLFKELEWYEERKVEDMPNYLKHTVSDGETTFHKIIKWDGLMAYEDEKQGCNLLMWSKNYNYKPATEEEFLNSQSVSTK